MQIVLHDEVMGSMIFLITVRADNPASLSIYPDLRDTSVLTLNFLSRRSCTSSSEMPIVQSLTSVHSHPHPLSP